MILLKKKYDTSKHYEKTGEKIEIDNSGDLELQEITADGNTHQYSYDGKNLIEDIKDLTWGINGTSAEYLITDNTIKITPLTTSLYAGVFARPLTNTFNRINGRACVFSFYAKADSNRNIMILFGNQNNEYHTQAITTEWQRYSFTISNPLSSSLNFYSSENNTTPFYIKDIQVEIGTTMTGFEKFVGGKASPNPEFPQEVENIKGDFKIIGKNLCNIDTTGDTRSGVTSTINGSSFTLDGTITQNAFLLKPNYGSTNYVKIANLDAGTYTLSINKGGGSISATGNVYIFVRNETSDLIALNLRSMPTSNHFTLTENHDIVIGLLATGGAGSSSYDNLVVNIQLEKGNTATPYEPYKEIKIALGGKNLYDSNAKTPNVYMKNDGTTNSSSDSSATDYMPVTEGYYTLSFQYQSLLSTNYRAYCFFDENKNFISTDAFTYLGITRKTIQVPSNAKYIRLTIDNNLTNIQFEKGSVATDYEPYTENPHELCKRGDVKDQLVIDTKTGVVSKIKRIGKLVLDGTTDGKKAVGVFNGSYTNTALYIDNSLFAKMDTDTIGVISNKLIGVTANNGYINHPANSVWLMGNYNRLGFTLEGTYTISNANDFLASNPVTIYYELATPITEVITTLSAEDLQKLKLKEGQNTLQCVTNFGFQNITVKYEDVFDYFEFNKILKNGYNIDEQPNLISKKQYANGKRKKIVTSYTDVKITINLGCFDGDTLLSYLAKLTDGQYQYYSLKDKAYKNANFIVTLPSQKVTSCADIVYVDDFEAILEKSSDVV